MFNLLDCSLEELQALTKLWGQPNFRAKQVLQGYYRFLDIDRLTDVPKELRAKLSENMPCAPVSIIECFESKDGTKKYLYRLADGNIVEGVLMRYQHGNTLCISTQVGCRMGCVFCASAIGGLVRNLTAGEILGQVLIVNAANGGDLEKRFVTNIVLMGSGEPLDNFDNTVKFLKLVNNPVGLGVGYRNISLSTCGIVPRIKELADMNLGVTLSVSLHAAENEVRKTLMPVTNKYSVSEVLAAARYYYEKTGRRVIFEYSVINGVNCSHAKQLADAVKGFPSHVNLILLNPVRERELKAPGKKEAYRFMGELEKLGVSVSLRRQMGVEIDGACGQLRNKFIGDETTKNSLK